MHGRDMDWTGPGSTLVSLNSDASIFPQKMSAAATNYLSSFKAECRLGPSVDTDPSLPVWETRSGYGSIA